VRKVPVIILTGLILTATAAFAESGTASYYTVKSCQREGTSGIFTATGERYDETRLTCARPSRSDFGKTFMVYSYTTGKTVFVRCTDLGPSKRLVRAGRVIDLSPRAFKSLGVPLSEGLLKVEVQEVLEK